MKKCIDCEEVLPFSFFNKKKSNKDGYDLRCKECRNIRYKRSTPELFVNKIYLSQVSNSVKRGHAEPSYTRDELLEWVLSQPNFNSLWKAYLASKYKIELAPSIDRLDNTKPYSLDNIELVTWQENRARWATDRRTGVVTDTHKPVASYTLDGVLVKEYISILEATRDVKGNHWGISSVANGVPVKDGRGRLYTPRSYKGFIWKWI